MNHPAVAPAVSGTTRPDRRRTVSVDVGGVPVGRGVRVGVGVQQ